MKGLKQTVSMIDERHGALVSMPACRQPLGKARKVSLTVHVSSILIRTLVLAQAQKDEPRCQTHSSNDSQAQVTSAHPTPSTSTSTSSSTSTSFLAPALPKTSYFAKSPSYLTNPLRGPASFTTLNLTSLSTLSIIHSPLRAKSI